METSARGARARFRVWLARYGPTEAGAAVHAVAIEPAEEGTMSAPEAEIYMETFNRVAAQTPGTLRAVALPVKVRYEGDLRPGELLAPRLPLAEGDSRGDLSSAE